VKGKDGKAGGDGAGGPHGPDGEQVGVYRLSITNADSVSSCRDYKVLKD